MVTHFVSFLFATFVIVSIVVAACVVMFAVTLCVLCLGLLHAVPHNPPTLSLSLPLSLVALLFRSQAVLVSISPHSAIFSAFCKRRAAVGIAVSIVLIGSTIVF